MTPTDPSEGGLWQASHAACASWQVCGKRAAAARGNAFTTPNDALVLWVRVEYDRQQNHYFQLLLSDKAGTGGWQARRARNWGNDGNQVVAVQFDTFPRRQGKFFLRVQEQGNGQEMSDKKLAPFPIRRTNPSLNGRRSLCPAQSRMRDDVSVTL